MTSCLKSIKLKYISDGEPNPDASRFVKTELRALESEELKPTEQLKQERFDKIVAKVREIAGPMPTEKTIDREPNNRPREIFYLKGASGKTYRVGKFTADQYYPSDSFYFSAENLDTEEEWNLSACSEKFSKQTYESMDYNKSPKLPDNPKLQSKGKYKTKHPDYKPGSLSQPPEENIAFEAFDKLLEDLASAERINEDEYYTNWRGQVAEEKKKLESQLLSPALPQF